MADQISRPAGSQLTLPSGATDSGPVPPVIRKLHSASIGRSESGSNTAGYRGRGVDGEKLDTLDIRESYDRDQSLENLKPGGKRY